jgi:hypothetical protein
MNEDHTYAVVPSALVEAILEMDGRALSAPLRYSDDINTGHLIAACLAYRKAAAQARAEGHLPDGWSVRVWLPRNAPAVLSRMEKPRGSGQRAAMAVISPEHRAVAVGDCVVLYRTAGESLGADRDEFNAAVTAMSWFGLSDAESYGYHFAQLWCPAPRR